MNDGYMEVNCILSNSIPDVQIDKDFLNIETLIPHIHKIEIYRRLKEVCPFARGNLIVDISFHDGRIQCLKYPLSMTDEKLDWYLEPLLKLLKEKYV